MKNYRIFGQFKTKSPLSHISESISTTSYLVQDPILQPGGEIEDVFCYNGNAWRGQLRDLAARYLIEKLNMTVSMDGFHLLFSGGKIGGDQSIDLVQARAMRQAIPMFSLFGGGVGNQILPGKMKVGNSYPICQEAAPALAEDLQEMAMLLSYRDMTMEKSFTRFDDSKDPNLTQMLTSESLALLEGDQKKVKKTEVSTQMRMTSELLVPGVVLAHEIDLVDVTDIELGAFVSALWLFGQTPYIGGQSNRGHGRVDYYARIFDPEAGETKDLIKLTGNAPRLSRKGEEAKAAYDDFLMKQYNTWIESKESEIRKLLGAPACGSLF